MWFGLLLQIMDMMVTMAKARQKTIIGLYNDNNNQLKNINKSCKDIGATIFKLY